MLPISHPAYLHIHPDDYVNPANLTHRDGGHTVTVEGAQFTLLADKSGCQTDMGLILATLPPFFAGLGLHLHRQTTEFCHVLRGALAFTCGAEMGIARVGSMLILPAAVAHRLWNPTPEPVTYLTIYSPAGAEQFTAHLAQAGAAHPSRQMLHDAWSTQRYDHFPVDE